MSQETPKVLYIAGWGRSGTTLLDNLLGQLYGFFSAGELRYLWERGLIEERLCGCGRPVSECPVWSKVLAKLGGIAGEAAGVVNLQEREARVRHTPRLLRRELRPSGGDLARYLDITLRLYRAVREVTGARVIVDSSKRPPDGAVLRLLGEVDAYFVHMVRDPRAVAYSWRRPKELKDRSRRQYMRSHRPWASTAQWIGWNLAISALRRRHGPMRTMLLRYEDFIARPAETVAAIAELVGEQPSSLPFEDPSTAVLEGNHTVSGNPSRFETGRIRLRIDDEWVKRQPLRDRLIVTALTAPLLGRYGYPIRVTRAWEGERR
ncbi:MAG: sulfotransferase [Actinomycetota bacterium]